MYLYMCVSVCLCIYLFMYRLCYIWLCSSCYIFEVAFRSVSATTFSFPKIVHPSYLVLQVFKLVRTRAPWFEAGCPRSNSTTPSVTSSRLAATRVWRSKVLPCWGAWNTANGRIPYRRAYPETRLSGYRKLALLSTTAIVINIIIIILDLLNNL